ncbi:hypothetical protein [Crenothrix polyspora]|uniref:Uncharacterized protein n=1 Tax=Crenothrix polyspora TaxID=360316 RepID=A0A1R4HFG7_9GAMM|nr:hypothetical protein [Crenothrix polyspora]SJM94974.1 hypothetical protein CRENPOLYSF1_610033 [Crenothrix polyspora]
MPLPLHQFVATIEIGGFTADFDVEFSYTPEELPTRYDPGVEAAAEIKSVEHNGEKVPAWLAELITEELVCQALEYMEEQLNPYVNPYKDVLKRFAA